MFSPPRRKVAVPMLKNKPAVARPDSVPSQNLRTKTWITVQQAAYVAGTDPLDMCNILAGTPSIRHVGLPGDKECRINYESLLRWYQKPPLTFPLPVADENDARLGVPLFLSY